MIGNIILKKKHLYPLITILKELVLYRDSIINLEIKPVQINIKGRNIIINFNILLLGLYKAVLKII